MPVSSRLPTAATPVDQANSDAGFVLDWGEDLSGLHMKYMRRGSGYYIDIGASQLVIDGKIKHVYGQVDHLTENAVVLKDGTASLASERSSAPSAAPKEMAKTDLHIILSVWCCSDRRIKKAAWGSFFYWCRSLKNEKLCDKLLLPSSFLKGFHYICVHE